MKVTSKFLLLRRGREQGVMFSYTDTILSIMQRIEVYSEIFKAISKEVQEYGCNQAAHRRGRDTYMFCRNNVNRFFTEEMMFRKNLEPYYDKEATKILLEGLDTYKEGVFFWLEALSESCQVTDELKYQLGIRQKESSYLLINQACKEACEGIQSAHSVHKM
ncbi:hypothetical protein [Enterococcus faecalis]|uniref:hypothetical protein n=1 Tax=Enterococcus faecalis TaxID=1351 RepID=UPI0015E2B023|nr:hypothetical protein [Enterococcus faecalis]